MTHDTHSPVTVQDYIAGRLSDTDRQVFEDQLLSDPNFVRDTEESLRLREGLEILRDRGALAAKSHRGGRAFVSKYIYPAAAALALIVLGMWIYSAKQSSVAVAASVAGLRARAPLAVVEHYSFAAVRAATTTPDLNLPSSGVLELRALTHGTDSGRTFRVVLDEIRGSKTAAIGSVEHLAPDAEGFVAIYADASKLEPGEYALWVESDPQYPAWREQFAFRLNRSSGTASKDK